MKVLQIVHNFLGEHLGGTERYTAMLAAELSRTVEVEVLTSQIVPGGAAGTDIVERDGRTVVVLQRSAGTSMGARWRSQRSIDRAFDDVLRTRRPDVVHVQHLVDMSSGLLPGLARSGVPFVVSLHDFWFACPRIDLLRRDLSLCDSGPVGGFACIRHCRPASGPIRGVQSTGPLPPVRPRDLAFVGRALRNRRNLRVAPRFVAQSEYVRERWSQIWLDARQIEVIPLGLPPVERAPRPAAALPLRFAYLGRISFMKGVDIAVDVFRDIDPAAARLTLHGPMPPDERAFFEHQLARTPNVAWTGPYELEGALRDVDVVIVPSRQPENWSLVTHEAFQRGLPVIGSRRGALPEVIHDGVDGVLFEGTEELRRIVRRMIDDPSWVDRLRAGIGPVPTIAESAARFEDLYARIIAGRRRAEA